MALIWSAAAPPGGPGRGAGAVGGGGKGRARGEVGVCHLSPCTRLARQSLEWRGVEGG